MSGIAAIAAVLTMNVRRSIDPRFSLEPNDITALYGFTVSRGADVSVTHQPKFIIAVSVQADPGLDRFQAADMDFQRGSAAPAEEMA
jgi:hypothetical protein